MTSKRAVLLILGLLLGTTAPCVAQSPGHPIIPFTTNYWNHWDHYWTTYLNDHPKYEMIEVTTFDNTKSDYKLIRVFLSEKTGPKTQYFYLNDEEAVKRSRANTYFRDITYKRTGKPGEPQGLYVKFTDKDNQVIEWTIDFDPARKMVKHLGGLTPSIHSVGSVLLYHLRTLKADTRRDKVLFDGKDFAHTDDENPNGKASWYNSDTYSSVIIFGDSGFQFQPNAITNTWGRTFSPSPRNKLQWVSNDLGKENFINFEVDRSNQIKRYEHTSFGRRFIFRFDPVLPSTSTARDGQVIRYAASFDDHDKLMTGTVNVSRTANEIVLAWKHDHPDWATTRSFTSTIKPDEKGYALSTRERPEPVK